MELRVNWAKAIPRLIEDYNLFKNPPNYYLTFPDISAGSYPAGGIYLFIGEVIKNWMDGNFTQICPVCKSTVYILQDGLIRLEEKEEIRMDVPLWLDFMKENYSDCLEEEAHAKTLSR